MTVRVLLVSLDAFAFFSRPKQQGIVRCKQIHQPQYHSRHQRTHNTLLKFGGAEGFRKYPVLGQSYRFPVPQKVGNQFCRGSDQHSKAGKPGKQTAGFRQSRDRILAQRYQETRSPKKAQQNQNEMTGKKILFAGSMKTFNFQNRVGFQGDRIFLFVAEHLHLEPGAAQLPPRMGAEFQQPLLSLCGLRVKVGSLGIVGHAKM